MDRLEREKLEGALEKYGISPSPALLDKFILYMDRILRENEKVNLTAIKNRDEFIEKHYIDSLAGLESAELREAKNIIDVGTGGGFPGIPLAIICPEKNFVLLDSLVKRLNIVEALAKECRIENIRVVHGRAEDLGKQEGFREAFDICVSRAVAPLPLLAELCIPFVDLGGSFIAYKGKEASTEVEDGKKAVEILGGEPPALMDVSGEAGERFLILVKKGNKTPDKYPRKAGIPEKRPLR